MKQFRLSRKKFSRSLRREMIAHSQAAFPREACGLVVCDRGGYPVGFWALPNLSSDDGRFLLDSGDYFRVLATVEPVGWKIGGVFHSHPRGPARPSATDLAAGWDPEWACYLAGRTRWGGWKVAIWLPVPFGISPNLVSVSDGKPGNNLLGIPKNSFAYSRGLQCG